MHSQNPVDYKKAHEYAANAIALGSNVTKWLYAASKDRLLVSQGKKQQYGTQFYCDKGVWKLYPVDNSITDKKRGAYYVPPLSKAPEIFRQKHNLKKHEVSDNYLPDG